MRVILAILLSVALVAATVPLLNIELPTAIPDQYLVVFHRNSTEQIRNLHVAELERRLAAHERVINKFAIGDLIGYSAVLSKDTLAIELEHPNVRYVEANQVVTISEDAKAQDNPTWGIDRIDQANLPLSKTYTYFDSAGAGIRAYVIDTGVFVAHEEFGGRAEFGYSAVAGEENDDLNGHGTHVAGTIGGTIYGVAKEVTVVAVKVLNKAGSGTLEGVIAGVEWATRDHTSRGGKGRSVANMSLSGAISATLDSAVENSIAAGITFVIAAGNNNQDACNYSPARVPTAITVGATTSADARATFSNYGRCVDLFAPGNLITAAWIGSSSATNTISGTSMAAPHAAGAVAVYLGHVVADSLDRAVDPLSVDFQLKDQSTVGVLKSIGTGSPNTLLFSPFSDISKY